MPELQTQVLNGLVLIAANWCSDTWRHMWVCVHGSENRGDSEVSQCEDDERIQELRSVWMDKRTDCRQHRLFRH